jgi:glycosyltransferase involved in cell wall biosynthesis
VQERVTQLRFFCASVCEHKRRNRRGRHSDSRQQRGYRRCSRRTPGIALASEPTRRSLMTAADVLCFSHLRWTFVFQRPNHLMSRCARRQRVFFIEEPVFDAPESSLDVEEVLPNLLRVVPQVRRGEAAGETVVNAMLLELCRERHVTSALHWYYTPMMLGIAKGLPRSATVYDCMDELANFLHAPAELHAREKQLLQEADVVFTGGRMLYESKRKRHPNVHAIPSSVDVEHFAQARAVLPAPSDQAALARPRIGYCGVIDERIDQALLAYIAQARPEWQLIMLGPVVKIALESLPKVSNIHYLGLKRYEELPRYLSSWDAAIMPFAQNDATRFISPTKTPEYLAAGKPVVSTPIADVIEPYGRLELVRIGADPATFVSELGWALATRSPELEKRRDAWLANLSWDATWAKMQSLLSQAGAGRSTSVDTSTAVSAVHV